MKSSIERLVNRDVVHIDDLSLRDLRLARLLPEEFQ